MSTPARATVALLTIGAALVAATRTRTPKKTSFFEHKHVVVTGGSRGLGFVLTRMLLAAGARVTICGRSDESLAAAAATLAAFGDALTALRCDVRDEAACRAFLAAAVEHAGPIDILINNAGVIEVGPFADQTLADYREAMDTHFWAQLYTMLAVLPAMRARRSGQIVNIASVGGVIGVPHLAPYSASKFAQVGLTQALAAEVAADGVTITSVQPGLMITGSPGHAIFKGRRRSEYAWFTLSDANPLLAVSVDAAARTIVAAIRQRRYQVTIGWTAQCARLANALLPQTTTRALALAARLLPAAGGDGTERHTGVESRSAWTENPLTALNTRAEAETNQNISHSATE